MINSFVGEYGWLSNFWPVNVLFDDLMYPSVEHAYQAAKTLERSERLHIRACKHAAQAKKAGRYVTLVEDWPRVKLATMELLLRRKFSEENPRLLHLLVATGDVQLVEGNWWNDTYWGVCKGRGENNLGKLLMKIRSEHIKDCQ